MENMNENMEMDLEMEFDIEEMETIVAPMPDRVVRN